MTARDTDACLCCNHPHTMNGFLCARCYRQRAHTRHWRWLDLNYANAMQAENALRQGRI